MRSETTKDKGGSLPPAVYSSQLSCAKVIFHEVAQDDSVTENRKRSRSKYMHATSCRSRSLRNWITFVDDSVVAVVAVGYMTDLPVQEDEYDTDSESDVDDVTPSDITACRSGGAVCVHFRLDL